MLIGVLVFGVFYHLENISAFRGSSNTLRQNQTATESGPVGATSPVPIVQGTDKVEGASGWATKKGQTQSYLGWVKAECAGTFIAELQLSNRPVGFEIPTRDVEQRTIRSVKRALNATLINSCGARASVDYDYLKLQWLLNSAGRIVQITEHFDAANSDVRAIVGVKGSPQQQKLQSRNQKEATREKQHEQRTGTACMHWVGRLVVFIIGMFFGLVFTLWGGTRLMDWDDYAWPLILLGYCLIVLGLSAIWPGSVFLSDIYIKIGLGC